MSDPIFLRDMMGLRGHSYQRFIRTKIGNRGLYSTKGANFNFHAFVQSFHLPIRSKSAPPMSIAMRIINKRKNIVNAFEKESKSKLKIKDKKSISFDYKLSQPNYF